MFRKVPKKEPVTRFMKSITKMLMEKMGRRIVLEIAEQKGQEELYQEDRIDIID